MQLISKGIYAEKGQVIATKIQMLESTHVCHCLTNLEPGHLGAVNPGQVKAGNPISQFFYLVLLTFHETEHMQHASVLEIGIVRKRKARETSRMKVLLSKSDGL